MTTTEAMKMYRYLRRQGFSRPGAAAIVANYRRTLTEGF